MQFRIHLGTALGHSGSHIDIMLMRHLDAQLGLPSLFGQLLCDISLFLGNPGQFDGQFTVQDMGPSSRLTLVGVMVMVRSMASGSRLTIFTGLPASMTSPSMAIRSHWA